MILHSVCSGIAFRYSGMTIPFFRKLQYEIAEYSYLSNSERSLKGKLIIMKDMAVVDEKDDVVFTFSLS